MQIIGNPMSALDVRESPKFPRLFLLGNRGRGTRWLRQILDRKWKYGRFVRVHCIRQEQFVHRGRGYAIMGQMPRSTAQRISSFQL